MVAKMDEIRKRFERFRTAFLLCPRKSSLADECDDTGLKKLLAYWTDMNKEDGGDVATRFQT
jgi:GTPase-activating protein BEM2